LFLDFGATPERRLEIMDNSLIVRIVAGVLALVVLAVIIMRRKKQA
jgi:hypothetical protein